MQSDNTAKQKTVPGRLSVALLYVTVNRLLIPALPAQTARETSHLPKFSAILTLKEATICWSHLEFLLFLAT